MTAEPIDPGVIELAGRVGDLARAGAAYHGHPDAGAPSARATALLDAPR